MKDQTRNASLLVIGHQPVRITDYVTSVIHKEGYDVFVVHFEPDHLLHLVNGKVKNAVRRMPATEPADAATLMTLRQQIVAETAEYYLPNIVGVLIDRDFCTNQYWNGPIGDLLKVANTLSDGLVRSHVWLVGDEQFVYRRSASNAFRSAGPDLSDILVKVSESTAVK